MSAKKFSTYSPDDDDIDAFLIQSAQTQGDEPLTDDDPADSSAGRNVMAGLNARLTHAERDLCAALTVHRDMHNCLDADANEACELDSDLDDWQASLERLEAALTDLPAAPADVAEADSHNATVNRNLELLRLIADQDKRIRDLEARLATLECAPEELDATSNNRLNHAFADAGVNRLIITMNAEINQKFPLYQNIMTIGRDPQNDIQIRSRFISRFHARVVSDSEGCVIEDMESQNGVCVNSQRVHRKPLKSGDLIDLGRVQLKFIDLMEGSSDEGQA